MAGGVVWRPLLAGAWLLWLLPWASAVRRSDFPAAFLFGTASDSGMVAWKNSKVLTSVPHASGWSYQMYNPLSSEHGASLLLRKSGVSVRLVHPQGKTVTRQIFCSFRISV